MLLLRVPTSTAHTHTLDLELESRALAHLVERRLLALRLVGEGRIVRVVDQHLDVAVCLVDACPVAREVAHDRRDLVGADAAHDHLALLRMARLPETRDVADEIASLLLTELDPADVARLLRQSAPVDVDSGELRVRERRCDIVERPELEQDADGDHEVVALLCRALEVRLAVVRRIRDEDATGDPKLLFGTLEPDERQMVESLVVEAADVSDESHLDRRRALRARRGTDDERADRGHPEPQQDLLSFHLCSLLPG